MRAVILNYRVAIEEVVASELPHQVRGAFLRFTEEYLAHVLTAEGRVFGHLGASQSAERRVNIDAAHHRPVVHLAGRNVLGPTDDEWHADTAFIEAAFHASQTVRALLFVIGHRAVVACEDDDCVFVQTEPFHAIEQTSDLGVVLL